VITTRQAVIWLLIGVVSAVSLLVAVTWQRRNWIWPLDHRLRRVERHSPSWWIFVVVVELLLISGVLLRVLSYHGYSNMLFIAGTVVLVGYSSYWRPRELRRYLAAVRAAGFRRCPRCFYDLRGSERSGNCPGCGEPYDPTSLKEVWTKLSPEARGIDASNAHAGVPPADDHDQRHPIS